MLLLRTQIFATKSLPSLHHQNETWKTHSLHRLGKIALWSPLWPWKLRQWLERFGWACQKQRHSRHHGQTLWHRHQCHQECQRRQRQQIEWNFCQNHPNCPKRRAGKTSWICFPWRLQPTWWETDRKCQHRHLCRSLPKTEQAKSSRLSDNIWKRRWQHHPLHFKCSQLKNVLL